MNDTDRRRIHADLDTLLERQGQPRRRPEPAPEPEPSPESRTAQRSTSTHWIPDRAALRYTLRQLAAMTLPERAQALIRDARRFAGDPEASR